MFRGGDVTPMSADENGYTPIHAAAAYAHLDMLKWLLTFEGSDINVRDTEGDTPLHHCDTADAAAFLIKNGADTTLRNNEEKTAYEVAVEDENMELASYLHAFEP